MNTDLIKNTRQHLFLLVALWLIVHIVLFWRFGLRHLLDAIGYVEGADHILAFGTLENIHHLFYIVPIGLIAFFRFLFPDQIMPFLIFQSVLSGFAVIAVYFSAAKIFKTTLAGLFAGVLFLLWWDNIHWNTTTMTESIACSFTCFMLYVLVHHSNNRKSYLLILFLMVIIFFTRPTGIVVIVGCIAFLLTWHWPVISRTAVVKFSVITWLIVLAFLGAHLMFMHWDFTQEYPEGNVITYMNTIEGEPLYDSRLRLEFPHDAVLDSSEPPVVRILLFIIQNPVYFIKISGLRIWYLLSGVRPYYSTLHNLITMTWMLAVYSAFGLGLKSLKNNPVKAFVLIVIVVNCGLIGISTVDWDNRFYIPMQPGIVLVAGGGIAYLMRWLKKVPSLWGIYRFNFSSQNDDNE